MTRTAAIAMTACGLFAETAAADFSRVIDKSAFLKAVEGRELTRPFIRLRVTPDGTIDGKGLSRPVTGTWEWKDGYFCRAMEVPGFDIPYNCQEVRVNGTSIRFRSDRGKGDHADFRIR